MCDIEDHPAAFEFLQQTDTGVAQWAVGGRTAGVLAAPIMCRTNRAQSFIPPRFRLFRSQDGIGPFHAENHAERSIGGIALPGGPMRREVGARFDDAQMPFALEKSIVGELSASV